MQQFLAGKDPHQFISQECEICKQERKRKVRLLSEEQVAQNLLLKEPFLSAPAVYPNNVPRYYSMLVRTLAWTKQQKLKSIIAYAHDEPLHPEDRNLSQQQLKRKRAAWLRHHDQRTNHLAGFVVLAKELPMRLTDTVSKKLRLFRNRRCFIHDW